MTPASPSQLARYPSTNSARICWAAAQHGFAESDSSSAMYTTGRLSIRVTESCFTRGYIERRGKRITCRATRSLSAWILVNLWVTHQLSLLLWFRLQLSILLCWASAHIFRIAVWSCYTSGPLKQPFLACDDRCPVHYSYSTMTTHADTSSKFTCPIAIILTFKKIGLPIILGWQTAWFFL